MNSKIKTIRWNKIETLNNPKSQYWAK